MTSTKNLALRHASTSDERIDHGRRQLFGAAATLVALGFPWVGAAYAQTSPTRSFGTLKRVNAGVLMRWRSERTSWGRIGP